MQPCAGIADAARLSRVAGCCTRYNETYLAQELHGVLCDKCLLPALINSVRSQRLKREADSECCAGVAGIILKNQSETNQEHINRSALAMHVGMYT